MYYIYEIFNDVTNRKYIGLTKEPSKRFKSHLLDLKNHTHSAEGIIKDYIRYGKEHFFFRIIDTANSKEEGFKKERHYMLKKRSYVPEYGYNGNDPRWNRKHPVKPIKDSELKRMITDKGYKISKIPWLIGIPYPQFVTKMNHQGLFTVEEMEKINKLINQE